MAEEEGNSVSEGSRVEQKIEPALEPVRELEEREFEPATSNDFSFFFPIFCGVDIPPPLQHRGKTSCTSCRLLLKVNPHRGFCCKFFLFFQTIKDSNSSIETDRNRLSSLLALPPSLSPLPRDRDPVPGLTTSTEPTTGIPFTVSGTS